MAMATNDKTVSVSGVVRAYDMMVKAYRGGRMGKRDMECVMLNLQCFLEDCEIYKPMFTITKHESAEERVDDEQ